MSKVNRHVLLSCLQSDLSGFNSVDKNNPFVDAESVAATLLLESVFKKFEDPNPKADAKAIDKFLAVNLRQGAFKLVVASSWDEEIVNMIKVSLDNFFHPGGIPLIGSYQDLFLKGETGSGASIAGRGGDFFTKIFSSELSTTSLALYSMYRSHIENLPSWRAAEKHRFANCNGPRVVEGNRLSCVPKNVDISRTICTEPTLNMWYQLGCGNIIRRRLGQFFGIDLESVADVNRKLAYLGSLDCPDSFSTIDLESASDSISLGLIDELFPKWFSSILKDLRSPVSRLPDGTTLQLNMVSTMGNGFTFPLQTLIFACVVSAVYSQMGISCPRVDSDKPEWSVFGDDIVVRRKAYDRVVHVLDLLGFKVNAEKSFNQGPFRESCGFDFFRGQFVRGVYLKRLSEPQDTYVAFNKLVRWSATQKIALSMSLQYLLTKARFIPVPFWEADDAGFKVPSWWPGVSSLKGALGSWRYRAVVPKIPEMTLGEDTIYTPRSFRKRNYNPDGLLVSIARGDWVDGACANRHIDARFFVQIRRVALNWDIPPVSSLRGFLNQERGAFNWRTDLKWDLRARRAVGPVAGPADGKQCETAFWNLDF